jgi:hypothetical protein
VRTQPLGNQFQQVCTLPSLSEYSTSTGAYSVYLRKSGPSSASVTESEAGVPIGLSEYSTSRCVLCLSEYSTSSCVFCLSEYSTNRCVFSLSEYSNSRIVLSLSAHRISHPEIYSSLTLPAMAFSPIMFFIQYPGMFIPDSGSRGQKGTGSRIWIRKTVFILILIFTNPASFSRRMNAGPGWSLLTEHKTKKSREPVSLSRFQVIN